MRVRRRRVTQGRNGVLLDGGVPGVQLDDLAMLGAGHVRDSDGVETRDEPERRPEHGHDGEQGSPARAARETTTPSQGCSHTMTVAHTAPTGN